MSIQLKRTDATDADFKELVRSLDIYLAEKDGDEHDFYDQYNQLDTIRYAIVAYEEDQPVSCGAIKEFSADTIEVKRMFTLESHRAKGLAGMVLTELENWAKELGYARTVLETGVRQTEAVEFYKKKRYQPIDNYGQYAGVENSLCFEKVLAEPKESS